MTAAIRRYYETSNANVHRGVHALSDRATQAYEEARGRVARFLNAREDREIVFVRGATEGINLVAQTYGRAKRENRRNKAAQAGYKRASAKARANKSK